MKISSASILLLVSALLTGGLLSAQGTTCFLGDDGFNLGCCLTPQPNLPQFPPISIGGRFGCLLDCALEADFNVAVSVTAPQMVLCDQAIASVSASSLTGPNFFGFIIMKYSRTWTEPDPMIGIPRQVWRFLINGDMQWFPSTAASTPCPNPPETINGTPVHMVGHIDYICTVDPTGLPIWQNFLSLSHLDGCISHAPWSAVPGGMHPERSYHLVAPACFSWAPPPAPSGSIQAEAVRGSLFGPTSPVFYQCFTELTVPQGTLTTQFQNCLCSTSSASPPRWAHQNLAGIAMCGGLVASPFDSLLLPGSIIPTGFATLRLGSWTCSTSSAVPPRELFIHFGVVQYQEPCSPIGIPFHIVTGVTTRGNLGTLFMPAAGTGTGISVPPGPYLTFIDLQNVNLLNPNFTTQIGWGRLFLATEVWNLNIM